LLSEVRKLPESTWAKDVRDECTSGISFDERPQAGDWLAIWGGSSATGCVALQLAKLAGLRVVCVLDVARNGARMLKLGADLLVDRLDEERAIEIVRGVTGGNLRYAIDTRSKESAALLARCLALPSAGAATHLVGLSGLPKEDIAGVKKHVVPIKAFHEAEPVGEALMEWVEKLLERRLLQTPDIEVAEGGLKGINEALDRLRDGSVNGPRIVVPLQK
jgi:NADPH:quinone reductase-like Zn-dependent oxidoreductase